MVNMKPWNWMGLMNALLISVLPLVVGVSCTSDKPKQETAQPSRQDDEPTLKKALSETDLRSSPGLVVIHCRKLSKALGGQPFPGEDLRSKCVEAILIMAEQATLGQSPEMMRKSPEEWMNEARSFGASKESISRAKKRIAADKKKADAEEKRQESAFLHTRPPNVAEENPQRRSRYCMNNGTESPSLVLAVSESALDEMLQARDDQAIAVMVLAGEAFLADQGTEVTVVDRGFTKTQVRVLSGATMGRTGWLPSEWVKQCK